MELFWAATEANDLILTLDLRHQLEDVPSIFGQLVHANNHDAFEPFKLWTKDLLASGIISGKKLMKL